MRNTCAFLAILRLFPLISAHCTHENHFCHQITFVYHYLEAMCTKFHLDPGKNARVVGSYLSIFGLFS